MEEFDNETDHRNSRRSSRESAQSVGETQDRAEAVKGDEEEWSFSDKKPGLASEAKAGLALILILVSAFALLVYQKTDMQEAKKSLVTKVKSGVDKAGKFKDRLVSRIKDRRKSAPQGEPPSDTEFDRNVASSFPDGDLDEPPFGNSDLPPDNARENEVPVFDVAQREPLTQPTDDLPPASDDFPPQADTGTVTKHGQRFS